MATSLLSCSLSSPASLRLHGEKVARIRAGRAEEEAEHRELSARYVRGSDALHLAQHAACAFLPLCRPHLISFFSFQKILHRLRQETQAELQRRHLFKSMVNKWQAWRREESKEGGMDEESAAGMLTPAKERAQCMRALYQARLRLCR